MNFSTIIRLVVVLLTLALCATVALASKPGTIKPMNEIGSCVFDSDCGNLDIYKCCGGVCTALYGLGCSYPSPGGGGGGWYGCASIMEACNPNTNNPVCCVPYGCNNQTPWWDFWDPADYRCTT